LIDHEDHLPKDGAMANTPLELYESAYQLQYYDKKIPDAIRIYEAIVREFPDSNECGYAVIQLQKIKSRDIERAIKSGSSRGSLGIIAFIAGLMALIAVACACFYLLSQLKQERQRTTLALSAIGKMYCGNEEGALKTLDEMKSFSTQDGLAAELSTDIFRKHNQAAQAMPLTPPPALPPLPDSTAKPAAAPAPDTRTDDAAGKKYAKTLQPRPTPAPTPKRGAPPVRPNGAPAKKNPLIVNPDSISYF
jgi:hypothetical protein